MYSHPSYVRDTPETLLHLRKITTGSRKRSPEDTTAFKVNSRTVSPLSSPHFEAESSSPIAAIPRIIVPKVAQWGNTTMLKYTSSLPTTAMLAPAARADRGKLDLLAMALEQEAAH